MPTKQQHARRDFHPWEQHVTCVNCAHPLDDNQRMKDALVTNTTAGWAKRNLHILAEMAADRGVPQWFADEVRRIGAGIQLMPDAPSRTVEYIEGSAAQKSENKTLCPYMYGTYQYNQWMAGFTEAADPLY